MVVVLDVVCSCMLLVGCGLLNVVVCCMLLGCCAGRMIQPVHSVHPLQLLSAKIVDGREKMDQLSKNLTAGKKIGSWSTPSTMLRPSLNDQLISILMLRTKTLINYNVSIEHVYLIYAVDLFFLLMFICLQRLIVSTGIHFCLMDDPGGRIETNEAT